MKNKLNIILLLCLGMVSLMACTANEPAISFDDAYPPVTQASLSDIEIGTSWYDFVKLHPEDNYVVIPQHAFFRIKDGRFVMVDIDYVADDSIIREISVYNRTTIATKDEFKSLRKGACMEEIIDKVGIPVSQNLSLSSAHVLYFPVSNGQICSMRISPADYTLQSFEFLDSLSSMPG